jgi:hypothetical protein
MKPISQALSATYTTAGATGKPLDLLGSDGRLEVVIPPGSLDFSHATVTGGGVPVGLLTLHVSQVHGHFVGQVSGLGGYEVQFVDSKGRTVSGVGGTVQYNTAYSNTHGTPNDTTTGDDRYDPLYCSTHSDCTGNYAHPDDHAWSVQVVTSITALGSDSSSLSPARTSYSYRLAKTGTYSGNPPYYCYPAGTDNDCVGDNWILSSDTNWLDYYDAEFRGFNVVTIAGPASGEERVDSYYSTKGWNTASSDGSNYDSGHLYEEDVYGIYGGTQEVLLSITQNQLPASPSQRRQHHL